MKNRKYTTKIEANHDVLWTICPDEIEDEIRRLRRNLSKVRKSRKEQPIMLYPSLDGKIYAANAYRVISVKDGKCAMRAESMRVATPEEVEIYHQLVEG